jgi:hypothetical protein
VTTSVGALPRQTDWRFRGRKTSLRKFAEEHQISIGRVTRRISEGRKAGIESGRLLDWIHDLNLRERHFQQLRKGRAA